MRCSAIGGALQLQSIGNCGEGGGREEEGRDGDGQEGGERVERWKVNNKSRNATQRNESSRVESEGGKELRRTTRQRQGKAVTNRAAAAKSR